MIEALLGIPTMVYVVIAVLAGSVGLVAWVAVDPRPTAVEWPDPDKPTLYDQDAAPSTVR